MKKKDGDVTEYEVDTAEELWDLISPQKYLLFPNEVMVFRGQANAIWSLEPFILRRKKHPIYSMFGLNQDPNNSGNMIISELALLKTFADNCDTSGLSIPGYSAKFRKEFLEEPGTVFDKLVLRKEKLWPTVEYYDMMSVAQHHGLPTRLLDWSYDSHIAAFFAASDALSDNYLAKATHLAIWALNLENIPRNVEALHIPRGNNRNIAAQKGIFTLLRQDYQMQKPFIGDHRLDHHAIECHNKSLVKISLPLSEAYKMLDLCKMSGVTAATVQPDFYGAAKATIDSFRLSSMSEWSDQHDLKASRKPAL